MNRLVVAAAVGLAAAGLAPDAGGAQDRELLLARGAEIAEQAKCATCHSLQGGALSYAGGLVEDWYAPAINAEPDARLPWTAEELYLFLRTGSSPLHGIAAGPMSEIVRDDLAALSDEDIRALAAFFAELADAPEAIATEEVAAAMEPDYSFVPDRAQARGEWLYVGYCVSCHFNRPEAQTALRPELALNTAVSAPDPTNLIRVVLRGVSEEEGEPDAYMPGFGMLLSNRDVADIASYLRGVYGAGGEPWPALEARVATIRGLGDPMR